MFNEIEVIWAATVNTRLNSIRKSQSTSETLLSWPSYKLPAGYRLVYVKYLYYTYTNIKNFHPRLILIFSLFNLMHLV